MKHSKIIRVVLNLCILIMLSQIVFSIGISPPKYEINFKPNLKLKFEYNVINTASVTKDFELYVNEDFAEYATLSRTEAKNVPSGGAVPFTVLLELPAETDIPGRRRLIVGATEAVPKVFSGVTAVAAINAPIYIQVPYPGKYLDISFSAPNVEVGQTAYFSLGITSRGKEFVHKVSAEIEVFDEKK